MRLLLVLVLSLIHLHASFSDGKLIFEQHCVSCHLDGKYFAGNKTAKEWKKLFLKDILDTLHQDKNISLPYLKKEQFKEDKKHLKAFLQKYSKDRGRHNSCF